MDWCGVWISSPAFFCVTPVPATSRQFGDIVAWASFLLREDEGVPIERACSF